MIQKTETTLIARVLPDIVAFVLGLGLAWFLEWETRDLVWSLWLCSLVLGYLTLFTAIGGGAWIGLSAIDNEKSPPGGRLKAMLVGLPVVRMHLLIFFFAFSHALHLDSFVIYAVVYSVYFFPWRELRRPATQHPLPSS